MKLTIAEVMAALNSHKKITTEKLPLKTSYKLARLLKDLEVEGECYETSTRETLLKYARKNENGEPIITKTEEGEKIEFDSESQQQCFQELKELETTEIEIKDYEFSLEDFGDLVISVEELSGFLPFIKEE